MTVDSDEEVSHLFPELLLSLFGHIGGAFVRDHDESSTETEKVPPMLSQAIVWISEADR